MTEQEQQLESTPQTTEMADLTMQVIERPNDVVLQFNQSIEWVRLSVEGVQDLASRLGSWLHEVALIVPKKITCGQPIDEGDAVYIGHDGCVCPSDTQERLLDTSPVEPIN